MPQTNYDGTTSDRWQVNTDQEGPLLRDEAGALAVRNDADSAYIPVRVGASAGDNDAVARAEGNIRWQERDEKGVALGYPSLDAAALVPPGQLASTVGPPSNYTLHADQTFKEAVGVVADPSFAADTTTSGTTSATYQTKLDVTTATFGAGSMVFVNVHFAVYGSQNGTNIQWRIVKDLGTGGEDVIFEETHVGILGLPVTPFYIPTLTGEHTYTLQWRRSSGGGTANILNAEIATWRLS